MWGALRLRHSHHPVPSKSQINQRKTSAIFNETSRQDDLGGLEAKSVTGEWLSADPIPGAILINVGDLLENFTSGR